MGNTWIGVDLDGTLATYFFWEGPEVIGTPILPMVMRVREWIKAGMCVKIFTARAAPDRPDREIALESIRKWSMQVFGVELEATAIKDNLCVAIYDDRAYHVETNTGRVFDEPASK